MMRRAMAVTILGRKAICIGQLFSSPTRFLTLTECPLTSGLLVVPTELVMLVVAMDLNNWFRLLVPVAKAMASVLSRL